MPCYCDECDSCLFRLFRGLLFKIMFTDSPTAHLSLLIPLMIDKNNSRFIGRSAFPRSII